MISTVPGPANAQFATGPEHGRFFVHIFSVNSGPELFSRFAHIAVLVEDRQQNKRMVYNYGTFDFTDPDLKWKYVQGFLTFWLEVVPYRITLPYYVEQDRTITLRTLALTSEQAELMVQKLNINARPENREYAYRHYLDNCSTRIRDLLDEVLGGPLKKQFYKEQTGRTYRDWTRRALVGMPIVSSIVQFSLGPAVDHPLTRWEEQFLPAVLSEDLDKVRIGPHGKPLVSQKTIIYESQRPPAGAETATRDVIVIAVLSILLLLGFGMPILRGKGKGYHRLFGMGLVVYGLLSGLAGLMLVLYWTLTAHTDTYYNENLLVMPFTNLWLLGLGFKLLFKGTLKEKTARMLQKYVIFGLGLIALDILLKIGPFVQDNWGAILLSTAAYVGVFFALRRTGLPGQGTSHPTENNG